MQYAAFSWGLYCLYYAIVSIIGGWILLVLSNARYLFRADSDYTKQYAVLLGIDTAHSRKYAVFSEAGYCL